ncbi:hypothetical protein AX14_002933 [Amanita brunnescens Koide BX004]|nr:hypothetical protein AX14_002933 [Amanita brunnescens Koide BX004]
MADSDCDDELLQALPPVQNPPFNIPREIPGRWTVDAIIPYVKTAMLVELSTIPLYLYTMYTIKNQGAGVDARKKIRAIAQEEMLHLSLAGNLLTALGGSLDLYQDTIVPKYPGHILQDRVEMNLSAADEEQLRFLQRIEAPAPSPRLRILDNHESIGKFYGDLIKGLRDLPEAAFTNCNPNKQFSPDEFHFPPGLAIIENRHTAIEKMELITSQGEGPQVGDESSHYAILGQLMRRTLPLRKKKNPRTKNYKYVYEISLAFDASYCYLLQTMQRVWQTERPTPLREHLINNIDILMISVMNPLSQILFDLSAAPCFNYYPPGNMSPLTDFELYAELVTLVAKLVPKVTEKQKFESILKEIKKVTPFGPTPDPTDAELAESEPSDSAWLWL